MNNNNNNIEYGKKILLTETFPFIVGGKGNINQSIRRDQKGRLFLTGRLQMSDILNGNERYYPKWILERQIKKFQQKIRNRTSYGQLDHPQSDIVSLNNVCILITQVYWKGNEVIGTVQVLSNSLGRDIQAIIQDGGSISISSRALGSLRRTAKGDEVQDDLQLITWDLVVDPSTQGATFLNQMHNYKNNIDFKVQKLIQTKQIYSSVEYAKQILSLLENRRNIK